MLEVVSAFVFGELVEDATAEIPELIDSSFSSIAEEFLELGEGEFDGVQIRRVGWQVTKFGAGRFDCFADTDYLVAGEIVHDDDVAKLQDGDQVLLNPGPEQRAVDGTLDGQRRDESLRS